MDGPDGGAGSAALGGEDKALLRKLILEKRRALSDREREEKSLAIQERFFLLEEYARGQVVHLFLSFRGEVATEGIVRHALAHGKKVVVPMVTRRPDGLIFSEIRGYPDDVAPGAYGILEPKKEKIRAVDPAIIDLFVLPGVAFDPLGNRLGYGAGYYDRILGRTTPSRIGEGVRVVGLAFEVQLVDNIPSTVHDARVHKIVTEDRVINCFEMGRDKSCQALS